MSNFHLLYYPVVFHLQLYLAAATAALSEAHIEAMQQALILHLELLR